MGRVGLVDELGDVGYLSCLLVSVLSVSGAQVGLSAVVFPLQVGAGGVRGHGTADIGGEFVTVFFVVD